MSPRNDGCALVTGASRGIGAVIARELAAAGWTVGVNCRREVEGAAAVVRAIEAAGGRALAVPGDVSDSATAEGLFTALERDAGPVKVLVNNAGIREDALAPTLEDDAWERVVGTNLTAAFRLTRRALPQMMRLRFGRIVNIASIAAHKAAPGQANYAAAKTGLIGMTRTIAAEVARRGVTVNAVSPGLVETEMTADVDPRLCARIPLGRFGKPAEIAACVGFLASDDASYLNGAVLVADGGYTASLEYR